MKTPVLGLLIAAAAFGASTVFLTIELKHERAQADALTQANNALTARIAELEKAHHQRRYAGGFFGGDQMARGEQVTGSLPPPGSPGDKPDTAPESGPPPMMFPGGRSEAFQKMMRSQIKANNKRLYADVGPALGLSKDEAAKLVDLLTEQQVDSFGKAREVADPAERKTLIDEARRDNQAQITDLLGATKAEQLKDYQDTLPARQELEMMSRQLEGSDTALSDDQNKRMLAALVEERKRVPMPQLSENATPEEYTKAYSDWQANYSERVASQAHSILTTEQYSTFNDFQQWQTEVRQQMSARPGRGPRGMPGDSVQFAVATPIGGDTAVAPPRPPAGQRRAQ